MRLMERIDLIVPVKFAKREAALRSMSEDHHSK